MELMFWLTTGRPFSSQIVAMKLAVLSGLPAPERESLVGESAVMVDAGLAREVRVLAMTFSEGVCSLPGI